ncbi:uncharacterized protein LOC111639197 [Centruroides sculpturatus]|uniref:uncharacterized protein LOC111639197 n=1 Tax=Centruroides sculpturatus TaxID=218467 RepID=UPI000C6E7785|nr:uncharacterized protein LOC111639197 [Centruroides sculpturatus]
MDCNSQGNKTQNTHTISDQSKNEVSSNSERRITIKFLQVNAQKCKAACSLLVKTASDMDSDIITIQEPYTIDNKIVRFGKWQILTGHTPSRPKCGIIVCNPKLDIALIPHLCSERVCVAIMLQSNPIYIMSIYFAPDENDDDSVSELSSVLEKIEIDNIIILGDINAKSAIWYHTKEDRRGRLIADLMVSHDLISTNMSTLPTFHTPHAEGWTDVCLATNNLSQRITNCETILTPSASDHRYIATELTNISTSHDKNRFLTKRTNWEMFRELFGQMWRSIHFSPIDTQGDLDDYVDKITTAIQTAAKLATSTKQSRKRETYWWLEELTELKKRTNKLKKKLHRTKSEQEKEAIRKNYRQTIKIY